MSTTQSVLGALVIAVVLAALHLAAPHIRRLPLVPERATGSFAGGLAVAYVFLHLLPEIAEGNEAIGEALSAVVEPTPLVDLGIFLVALAGFAAFYGLQRLADRRAPAPARLAAVRAVPVGVGASGGGERAAEDRAPEPAGVYWLHLGSFMVYNALITYTMALRLRTGLAFAVLFTIAMGLHFVLTDRSLEEHYPRRFPRSGRLLLAGALLAGWLLDALFAPTSALLVALLTALLGGSILLNVFKEELPSTGRSSYPWFLVGLVLYAGLLALITAVGE
ncbi:MAG TPA: hypothetical protein VE823_10080 [Geodermatophilus sp.]|nr:hypothetical protein [Geodermatophilus sp.]